MAASGKGSLAVGTHFSALHGAHLFRENSASYLPEPVLSAPFGGKAGKQEWERFFVGGCGCAKKERDVGGAIFTMLYRALLFPLNPVEW